MPGGWCTPPTSPRDAGDTTVRGSESPNTVVGQTEVRLERFRAAID